MSALPICNLISNLNRTGFRGLQQSVVIEPGHPFERREFQGLLRLPGRPSMYQFALVEAVARLGQSVVVAVPLLPNDGSTPASASRSL